MWVFHRSSITNPLPPSVFPSQFGAILSNFLTLVTCFGSLRLNSNFFSATKGMLFYGTQALNATFYHNNVCPHFHILDTNSENVRSATLQIACVNLTKGFVSNIFFLPMSSIEHILHITNTSIMPTNNK